ncbi:MAG: prephenate dehydrogenase [Nitrospirota bacterium]|nr:prephenate dehydrogenase [Nitrospirota bacterium]
MSLHFRQVTIVGVGLIGGSLGMILKQQEIADRVVGVGRSLENLELAVKLGAIDAFYRDPKEAMKGADLVILATPVEHYASHLQEWGHLLEPGTIVSDVGSVKGKLVGVVEGLVPEQVQFVGAHPIAGKEKSGVGASCTDLFKGAVCIVTPTSHTDAQALSCIQRLWEAAGSVMVGLDPFLHDRILGAVSHLPHVVAFALMNALLELQEDAGGATDLFAFSGGGLRDTTRIAASSPEMWRDIFLWNRENLLRMIEVLEGQLHRFQKLLEDQDGPGLEHVIAQARDARRQLP